LCGCSLWTAHNLTPVEDCPISQTPRVSPAEPEGFLLFTNAPQAERAERQHEMEAVVNSHVADASRIADRTAARRGHGHESRNSHELPQNQNRE
jgi:hypothetical protein